MSVFNYNQLGKGGCLPPFESDSEDDSMWGVQPSSGSSINLVIGKKPKKNDANKRMPKKKSDVNKRGPKKKKSDVNKHAPKKNG